MSVFPVLIAALLAVQLHVGENKNSDRFSVAKTRLTISTYGKCIAKMKTPLARQYVLEDTQANQDRLIGDWSSYCLSEGVGLRFRPESARGAMAEYLIGKDYPGAPTLSLEGVKLSYAPRPVTVMRDGKPVSLSELSPESLAQVSAAATDPFMLLGDCLWRSDQSGSRALLMSKLNKLDEQAAVEALTPAMQRCTAKGTTLKIDITGLRTSVAIAYYLLANAVKGPAL